MMAGSAQALWRLRIKNQLYLRDTVSRVAIETILYVFGSPFLFSGRQPMAELWRMTPLPHTIQDGLYLRVWHEGITAIMSN